MWEFNDRSGEVRTVTYSDIAPIFTLNTKGPIEIDSAPAPGDQSFSGGIGHKAIRSLAARLGLWDELWPMTLDYINAFLPALIDLEPDLVHCHDYHPMPAVASYVMYKARQGKKVPWVYDAHEWLPGQNLPGPTAHKAAWLAVERKLIGAADAVISVSEVLASKMKQRHRITDLPTVVTNAPPRGYVPLVGDRTDIRTDIGLPDDVPLLVYVGKLSEPRGIFTAAEALEYLPTVHLAFVGSNSPVEIARLRRIAAGLGAEDRVHILQYVPAESVTAYVSTADIGISPLLPTEAHHSALPTKIREYLHARLPLVVSDMREQSKFIKETRVGEVHAAGDATDFARAVKQVLADRQHYRSNLTEELLNEHSWENQVNRLQKVWGALVADRHMEIGADEKSASFGSHYRRSFDDNENGTSLAYFGGNAQIDSIAEHWLSHYGDILCMHRVSQRHLEAAIDQFEQLKEHSIDLLLYAGAESIFSRNQHKKLEQEYRELYELGIDTAIYVGSNPVLPTRRIATADPLHPLAIASSKVRGSFDRRIRLFSQDFRDLPMRVFTHSFLASTLLPQAVWLPPIVPLAEGTAEADPRELKVAVLPTNRSSEERSLIKQAVRELRHRGINVSLIRGRGMKPKMTRQYDVLIHSLHRIDMCEATAHHMASGGVLVGGRPYAHTTLPYWEATQSNLVERVVELVQDADAWQNESERSLAFSRDTFDADNVVRKIMDTVTPQL
jgi:glycosyltransferase involved in cell wall biosynthesis